MTDTRPITIEYVYAVSNEMEFPLEEAQAAAVLRNARIHIRASVAAQKHYSTPRLPIPAVQHFGKFPEKLRMLFGEARGFERVKKARGTTLSQKDELVFGTTVTPKLVQLAGSKFKSCGLLPENWSRCYESSGRP